LQRKVPFLAPLVPVLFYSHAESVVGAPVHVLLNGAESQRSQSVSKWATAKSLIDHCRPRPLLIREISDDTEELVCTFLADLIEVWLPFPVNVNGNEARLAWLQEKSCVQLRAIAGRKVSGTSEEIEQARKESWDREIAWAMQAKTNYRISNLRRIQPLPLPKLTKVGRNEPLSPAYIRSYSICWFPESEIQIIHSATPDSLPVPS
jgi:hypothetical protein